MEKKKKSIDSLSAAQADGDGDAAAAATQSSRHGRQTPGAPLKNPPMTCNHGNRQQTSCKLCACASALAEEGAGGKIVSQKKKKKITRKCFLFVSSSGGHFLSE